MDEFGFDTVVVFELSPIDRAREDSAVLVVSDV